MQRELAFTALAPPGVNRLVQDCLVNEVAAVRYQYRAKREESGDVLITFHPAEAKLPVCVRQDVVAVNDYGTHQVRKAFRKVESA